MWKSPCGKVGDPVRRGALSGEAGREKRAVKIIKQGEMRLEEEHKGIGGKFPLENQPRARVSVWFYVR